jgi:hypothetical protein
MTPNLNHAVRTLLFANQTEASLILQSVGGSNDKAIEIYAKSIAMDVPLGRGMLLFEASKIISRLNALDELDKFSIRQFISLIRIYSELTAAENFSRSTDTALLNAKIRSIGIDLDNRRFRGPPGSVAILGRTPQGLSTPLAANASLETELLRANNTKITVKDLLDLTGNLSHSSIIVQQEPAIVGYGVSATVSIKSPGFKTLRFILLIDDFGNKRVHLDSVKTDGTFRLLPQVFILKLLQAAERQGFSQVTMHAANESTQIGTEPRVTLVGAQTWPMLGFDGKIGSQAVADTFNRFFEKNPETAAELGLTTNNGIKRIKPSTRLSDLLFTSEGEPVEAAVKLWRKCAESFIASISFDPDSKSYKVFKKSLARFGLI